MPNYRKPDMYSDADWEMVQGYMAGKDGLRAQRSTAATCMAIATGFLIGPESRMSGQKFFAVAQR